MKLCMLYRPNAEFARMAEDYARDFEHSKAKQIELISLDTQEGAHMAELYGIVQYPALLAIREDAQLLKHWEGEFLPTMNEVAGYL